MRNILIGMAIMALICSVALNIAQYRGTFSGVGSVPLILEDK